MRILNAWVLDNLDFTQLVLYGEEILGTSVWFYKRTITSDSAVCFEQTDDTEDRVYLCRTSRDSSMPKKLADLLIMALTDPNGNVKNSKTPDKLF
jgi:hypothetical protein